MRGFSIDITLNKYLINVSDCVLIRGVKFDGLDKDQYFRWLTLYSWRDLSAVAFISGYL